MKIRSDFCVIGAGIAGLATARVLARSGATVTIVEARSAGGGASRAAAGMLAPHVEARMEEEDLVRFGIEALEYYPRFVAELEAESGQRVGFRSEGTLMVATDRDELEHLRHIYDEQIALGLDVQWLGGYECRQLEPHLAATVPGGVFSASERQVDNRLVIAALIESCRRSGVRIIEGAAGAVLDGGAYPVVRVGEIEINADHFIVATGAETDVITGALPELKKIIRPVKGQIMRLDSSRIPVVDHVVRSSGMYLVPKDDGHLVLGASAEDRGFDRSITAGEIFELLRAAWECVPAIYDLPIVETMVGFRPAAIDNAPLLGDSGHDRISLAMAFYRHGILFSPLAAEVLGAWLVQQQESQWLERFSPGRFHGIAVQRSED